MWISVTRRARQTLNLSVKVQILDPQLVASWEGWQSLAYCTCLENKHGFIPIRGSNPLPSAVTQGMSLHRNVLY